MRDKIESSPQQPDEVFDAEEEHSCLSLCFERPKSFHASEKSQKNQSFVSLCRSSNGETYS